MTADERTAASRRGIYVAALQIAIHAGKSLAEAVEYAKAAVAKAEERDS